MSDVLPPSFFRRPAEVVALDLLGRWLVRDVARRRRVVRIVETEAYLGAADAASHARGGLRSRRNDSLYLPGGHAYVYLVYGVHHCFNVVTGARGMADAVLIRAGEPIEGEEEMRRDRHRGGRPEPGDVAGGPGKLCQALAIDLELDGAPLSGPELSLAPGEPVAAERVCRGSRIGVGYAGEAAEWPLRFAERDNRHVSRPWPWKRGGR